VSADGHDSRSAHPVAVGVVGLGHRGPHPHLSWLEPHTERRLTVVGSKKMATFGDMELERKLIVYDTGFDEDARIYGEDITRSGDVFSPRVPNVDPHGVRS